VNVLSVEEVRYIKDTLMACQSELVTSSHSEAYGMLYEAMEILDSLLLESEGDFWEDFE
jgi:hypothetical protein